jgi:hypothetical protein
MSGSAPGIEPVPTHRNQRTLRWLSLALIVAVVAAAFLLPLININRYHRTISETLARSIGHPVHLGSVKLELLPRPGLAITDFTVEEDPSFGAEPLLRSPSVMVSVRLTSLWRGRLEVSRIDLDDASVNLVHDARGQWNFASLLEQASRIPNAPTAQRHSSGNPRFPYIEFKSARINFKSGLEKEGFAFLNSDFSIWLDNPNQWRLRFEAQPARTDLDLDLADTGVMRLEGSLDRAAGLEQMAVKLHAEWNGAPLGQASELLFGDDTGWRGDLRTETDIAGDLRDLHLTTRLRVAGAHRQEFSPVTPLDVDARCRGDYRHATRSLENLTCLWPVESGHLLLTGEVPNLVTRQSRLALEINQIPASFALNVLGLMRAGLPSTLRAKGLINGNFTYATLNGQTLDGQATVEPLSVAFDDGGAPFVFPAMHFGVPSAPVAPASRHRRGSVRSVSRPSALLPAAILLQPAAMNMGAPNPFQVSGQFTPSGFSLRLTGEAGLDRLKTVGSAFGSLRSSMAHLASEGVADVDLTFTGPWLAEPAALAVNGPERLAGSSVQGWLHLQHAQAKLDWLPEPVEIVSAAADFSDDRVRWSNANVTVNGIAARGSADAALRCNGPDPCPVHFNVDIPNLDAATLQSALLGAGQHGELLDTILAQVERKTSPWPAMSGQAQVENFALGTLVLHDIRSSLSVREHRVEIVSLDAAALGGSVHTTGTVEAAGSRPQYALEANWSGINVSQIAGLFAEKWPASGVLDGGAKLVLQGYSSSNLASSAQGTFHWVWSAGSLAASSNPNGGKLVNASLGAGLNPGRFSQWSADGNVVDGTLTLTKTGATNPVSGTISFDRKLDLVWPGASDAQPVHLGGTLAHPVIESAETGVNR